MFLPQITIGQYHLRTQRSIEPHFFLAHYLIFIVEEERELSDRRTMMFPCFRNTIGDERTPVIARLLLLLLLLL